MPRRILVVDDIEDAAEMLRELLIEMGHEAMAISDPRDAAEAAAVYRPDAVLLDIGMPYINGYELLPLIRERLKPARVVMIAVTAWGSAQDRAHSRAAGFDDHSQKPVSAAILGAALERFFV